MHPQQLKPLEVTSNYLNNEFSNNVLRHLNKFSDAPSGLSSDALDTSVSNDLYSLNCNAHAFSPMHEISATLPKNTNQPCGGNSRHSPVSEGQPQDNLSSNIVVSNLSSSQNVDIYTGNLDECVNRTDHDDVLSELKSIRHNNVHK